MAELSAETGYTVHQCQQEYEQARQRAVELKQVAAEISAITGKARLYGMDKDVHVNTDQPDTIDNADLDRIRDMAKAATRLRLA